MRHQNNLKYASSAMIVVRVHPTTFYSLWNCEFYEPLQTLQLSREGRHVMSTQTEGLAN
jgi:hypothetical protein